MLIRILKSIEFHLIHQKNYITVIKLIKVKNGELSIMVFKDLKAGEKLQPSFKIFNSRAEASKEQKSMKVYLMICFH